MKKELNLLWIIPLCILIGMVTYALIDDDFDSNFVDSLEYGYVLEGCYTKCEMLENNTLNCPFDCLITYELKKSPNTLETEKTR